MRFASSGVVPKSTCGSISLLQLTVIRRGADASVPMGVQVPLHDPMNGHGSCLVDLEHATNRIITGSSLNNRTADSLAGISPDNR